MSITGIGSLEEGTAPILLTIRLIRKWNPRFKQDNISYLFIDEQNNVIQAVYSGRDQQQIETRLTVYECYEINDYACTPTDSNISIIDNPLMLRIGDATTINKLPNVITIPNFYFSFSENKDLQKMSDNHNALTDYAGILTGIEDKTTRDGRPYINLKLVDSSNYEIRIQLWSELLKRKDQFDRQAIEKSKKPVALAITSVKFSPYAGGIALQATSATHIYIEPEHPAIHALLHSYMPNMPKKSAKKQSLLPNAEKTTIKNLLISDQSIPAGKIFLCTAHIARFLTEKKWYYRSCHTCQKTMYKTGERWWCSTDGYNNDADYTYRIDILLSDNDSEIKATMFNSGMETLLKKSCRDLVTEELFDDDSLLPYPILQTTGQQRQLILKSQAHTPTTNTRYIVEEVLDPETEESTTEESSSKAETINVRTPSKQAETGRLMHATKRSLDIDTADDDPKKKKTKTTNE